MTAKQRWLPGKPRPNAEVLKEYEDHRHDLTMANVESGRSVLVPLLYPDPERLFRWRVKLSCGCVREELSYGDDANNMLARADTYDFTMREPSPREVDEYEQQLMDDFKASYSVELKRSDPALRPERASIYGTQGLAPGERLCEYRSDCAEYTMSGGPTRDIVEWVRRRDGLYTMEPFEVDGEVVIPAREYGLWDVKLSCGHYRQERTRPEWKVEDGFTARRPLKVGLQEVLNTVAKDDGYAREYWRRVYEEGAPDPEPFAQCHTCACVKTVVAYQRVGWLKPKPKTKPVVRPPVPRKTLQRRLEKLEAEAAELRRELKARPEEESEREGGSKHGRG